ncbi:MAG: alpha-galactosidase [Candidatus Poribacteria bacterium]|nr:alpha-galactosidase [Candidatus Poribacteria bacterium]MDE0504936.1 alpha-galactosidase [Candidatus Poribacteria bacterium]
MWTDELRKILEGDLEETCSSIPLSFRYADAQYKSLPQTWKNVKEEKTFDADRCQITKSVKDANTGLLVTLEVTVYKSCPSVDWVVYYENRGDVDTPILESILPLDAVLSVKSNEPVTLHQIHGDACNEQSFLPFQTRLYAGEEVPFQPTGGRSSNTVFPYFTMEHRGEGVIVAIGWTGQWKATLSRSQPGSLNLQAGMEHTHFRLRPGEKIRTPRVLLMPWSDGLEGAHNQFRRLMFAHYVPRVGGELPDVPIAENNFDVYHSHPIWPSEAGQLDFVDKVAQCGIDTYWLDAAWFEGNFPRGVGNWFAKPREFPRGLKPISDAVHENGMRFLVWFEPGRAHEGTEVWKEHSDWVLRLPDQANGVFNFGIPEARDWMTERIGGLIDESGIDIYREDFNLDPLEYWRAVDAPDRQGMTEIKWVMGFYQFWDDLLSARPNLIIDNCASGGRRIDLETCMRAIPMWRSDTSCGPGHSDWHQVQTIGLSSYIVLHLACTHSHETYDCRSSATIGGVSQWQLLDVDFPFELAREATGELKANRPYWLGDFYPLTEASYSPNDWLAFQLHRSDLDEGMILAFRRENCTSSSLQVSPRGLCPDGNYSLTLSDESRNLTNRQLTGAEILKGLSLDIPNPRESLLVTYRGE